MGPVQALADIIRKNADNIASVTTGVAVTVTSIYVVDRASKWFEQRHVPAKKPFEDIPKVPLPRTQKDFEIFFGQD